LIALTPLLAIASSNQDYMIANYNIKSSGNKLNDEQCQEIFNHNMYYNIIDDKPNYKKTYGNLEFLKHDRLSTTFINKTQRLFYGQTKVKITLKDQKPVIINLENSFVLNTESRSIRGSFYSHNYCSGNFIGIQQKLNYWHNSQENKLNRVD
jgi:hypothetical protein